MKISHKVLFLGFKNKASFIFASPLLRNLLLNKRKKNISINICLTPSLLLNFLNQKALNDFSRSVQDKSLKVLISIPDLKDFCSIVNGSKPFPNLIKYFFLEYILLIPILIFYFFYFRRIPFLISNSDLVITNKFNLLLLSGTSHKSGNFILSRILSNPNPKYNIIWLPHAPHNSSILIDLPKVLKKSKTPIDYWLPTPNHEVESTNRNISTFVSGYPPFSYQEIIRTKSLILKKKINSRNHNLIIMLRKNELKGEKAQNYTYDYEQTNNLLKNLNEFVISNNFSKVSFCLHPSTIMNRLKNIIDKFEWPKYILTYDYFLSLADKNSLIVGSYSSVLLHSAFLGFKTICLKDHIVKRLAMEEPEILKLYKNSPIIFCEINSKKLNMIYQNMNSNSFENHSLENISNSDYLSDKFYLVELANENFLKSVERIYKLS